MGGLLLHGRERVSLKSRMSQLSVISRELVQCKVARILLTIALGLIRKYAQYTALLLDVTQIFCNNRSLVRT